MDLLLLPWSARQSKINLINGSFWEVGNRFRELDPLRRSLMKELGVDPKPLSPAWRRYRGRFWEELCVWALPGEVRKEIEERGLVLSPLLGLVGAGDPVPPYSLDWGVRYNGHRLVYFWKRHLKELVQELFRGKVILDLAGRIERSVLNFPEDCVRVVFEYFRAGRRVINSLPHRAYTLRYIVEMGVGLDDLKRINFLDYRVKEIREEGNTIRVRMVGEGKYI